MTQQQKQNEDMGWGCLVIFIIFFILALIFDPGLICNLIKIM